MKNSNYERKRRAMREYHRVHKQWPLNDGIYLRHSYPTHDELSWWDDVGFYMSHYRVVVWWRHPRMVFNDKAEDYAHAQHPYPEDADWGKGIESNPIWKKSRGNRKRIAAYQYLPDPSLARDAWYKSVREATASFLRDTGLVVTSSMTVTQLDWARGIRLVAPFDVRTKADAVALGKLAKRLYLGETTIAAEFPGYQYSRHYWNAEQPKEGLRSHGLA